ncbi:MAG: TIR domain-containing protein [Pseudomonadota bacterium]
MAHDAGGPTLFLSYAHSDRAKAQRLAAVIGENGYTVWWDALIEGGTRYAKSIDEALAAADAVLVLWSKASIDSDWVRDEAAQGRDRHRLVPLSLDGSLPPLGFRQYQMIDLSGWRGRADAPQLVAVRRAVAAALGEEPAPLQGPAAARFTRRQAVAGGTLAVAAIASGGAFVGWRSGIFAGTAQPRSIAVLPFRNLSGDSGQAYLSDGVTEEIRSALARNLGLMVLAGTSSNAARDKGGDAKAIAARLGVTYLLEGSVQRAGNLVRVGANLTNGATGFSEWSQQVERKLEDIFAFESEIARTVSNALSVEMATDAPAPGGTRNAQAYEAYLRGKALYNAASGEETDRAARANFEIAVAADSKFALAHAALSRALASIASNSAQASELKPLYGAAVTEAERAIALAPTMPQGQLALGYAKFAGFLDVRGARPSFDRAYQYGRGDADIVLLYALYCVRAGRFGEARDAIERALALDPLNPRTERAAGSIAFASRRYDEAIGHYRRALVLNPQMTSANAGIALALMQLGRLDQARAAAKAEKSAMFGLTALASIEHRAGNNGAAQQALDLLVAKEGDSALYQQAEVMAQWGRTDAAFALLAKAHGVGDSGLTATTTDPLLDPISKDPRFARFVRDIGFA